MSHHNCCIIHRNFVATKSTVALGGQQRPHIRNKFSPLFLSRAYASRPNPNQQPIRVLPFLLILGVGTGTYVYMVKSRAGESQKPRGPSVTPE